MKVLVTGANGYIGRHVVTALLDKGAEVIACDIQTSNVDIRAMRIEMDLFTSMGGGIFSRLGSPDVCLHMAWRNGFQHNAPTHIGDLSAHYKFLTSLIDDGLKQLAVMGTMHEVGYWDGMIEDNTPCNPTSMYGIAKDALRRALILYAGQKDCILQWLRGFYIYGDDRNSNSIFGKIFLAADRGMKTFPFTTGKNKCDFISIDELANQISSVVLQKKVNGIINCCSGKPISLAEQVEWFIAEHKLDIKLEYGAFPDRPYDSPCKYGDVTKINQIMKGGHN